MARIFLSPLIVDIRAKQSDTVFSKWRGVNYIRSRVIPTNPNTSNQQSVRNALKELVKLWQGFTFRPKVNWNYYATGKSKSGFNAFIGTNATAEKEGNLLVLTKDNGFDKFTSFGCNNTGGSGTVTVNFAPDAIPTKHVFLYIRKPHTGIWVEKHEMAVGNSYTFENLDAGEDYEVYGFIASSDAEGTLTGDHVGEASSCAQAAGS